MIKLLLLLLGGAKFGKLLTTGGTMLISLVVYGWMFGWRYAAGFIALLFLHEMGHYLAARQRGLDVGAPTFIPFLGAWIEMKQLPHNAETEAWVGLGGPLIGSIGALACYLVAANAGPDMLWLLAVSYAGFFLNLFNLIPISPLDGGRITAVLSPRIWLLGAPVLVGVFMLNPSPVLILVALMAAPQLMKAWRYRADDPANAIYYQTTLQEKITYSTAYLGLLIFLSVMTHDVHEMLQAARP
ncbi:MAG TPA: site-2 protease family protein [Aquabacterium sp.]|uniref:site-2 protease family protein n=1 Tax=Aquabacterium sp. TaxID=1872578 RepID=UPI002E381036|nr:site-2 protease family protein [Aquabacterium sp.]HEX5372074.1 site-2 protease family protein [Aquabacterium sp.]